MINHAPGNDLAVISAARDIAHERAAHHDLAVAQVPFSPLALVDLGADVLRGHHPGDAAPAGILHQAVQHAWKRLADGGRKTAGIGQAGGPVPREIGFQVGPDDPDGLTVAVLIGDVAGLVHVPDDVAIQDDARLFVGMLRRLLLGRIGVVIRRSFAHPGAETLPHQGVQATVDYGIRVGDGFQVGGLRFVGTSFLTQGDALVEIQLREGMLRGAPDDAAASARLREVFQAAFQLVDGILVSLDPGAALEVEARLRADIFHDEHPAELLAQVAVGPGTEEMGLRPGIGATRLRIPGDVLQVGGI